MVEGEESRSQGNCFLMSKPARCALRQLHGSNRAGMQRERLKHMSVDECAMYSWQKGQPRGEILGIVSYVCAEDVSRSHLELQTLSV